jgi:hypothetical protein
VTLVSGGAKVEYVGAATEPEGEWSLVEVRIPETVGFVPSLRCFPRVWEHEPPAWSDADGMRVVRVESVDFDTRFDARVDASQEENWLLQLLTPEFEDWLAEAAPPTFGFEVHEGVLRCFEPGHLRGADADRLVSDADTVAERVRSEALESEGLGVRELGLGIPPRIERAVDGVTFASMPPDSRTAARRFRGVAARDPRVYIAALGGVVAVFSILIWLLLQLDFDLIEIAADIIGWIGPKGTGIGVGALALAGWVGAIPGAITIASQSYGRVAFAREYAKARHYRLESPQSFHRRLMRVEFPAPAEFVFRGHLAGERQGHLVLCRSRRGPLASYDDAVVVEAHAGSGGGQHDGIDYSFEHGYLVVWRSASADRSAAGLDGFVNAALALVPQTSASSMSPSGS